MKPRSIAALAATALLAGGVLVAGDFGDNPGPRTSARNASALRVSPERMSKPKSSALKTVNLKVDNMFCASCPIIVRRTLERVEGVREVQVSFRSKTATVAYDPAQCEAAGLTAALTEMGFPSTVVRTANNG